MVFNEVSRAGAEKTILWCARGEKAKIFTRLHFSTVRCAAIVWQTNAVSMARYKKKARKRHMKNSG
jgi:hypothetical protein